MAPDPIAQWRFEWIDRISRVARKDWDALARPLATPLLEYDWLDLLERSGSVTAETGWQPCHLTVWEGAALVAAAPLYIKSHSQGEFVFDGVWAELADSAGIRYYPKLVGMSPVSPVAGYRFLADPRMDGPSLAAAMLSEIERFGRGAGLSGIHLLFVDEAWKGAVTAAGYFPWVQPRFVWENRGYQGFADYLDAFSTGQRRNIRRERRAVAEAGISVRPCPGEAAPARYFDLMYDYYLRTNAKFGPWGCRYLNRAFFRGMADTCRRHLLFMAARENGPGADPMAMALLLAKGDRLYGRYWGARRTVRALHFEVCYYGPINWAIQQGLSRFDPGMGGDHKLRRGFGVRAAVSLHRFFDPRLQRVFNLSMEEVNRSEIRRMREMNRAIPFAEKPGG